MTNSLLFLVKFDTNLSRNNHFTQSSDEKIEGLQKKGFDSSYFTVRQTRLTKVGINYCDALCTVPLYRRKLARRVLSASNSNHELVLQTRIAKYYFVLQSSPIVPDHSENLLLALLAISRELISRTAVTSRALSSQYRLRNPNATRRIG